MAATKTAKSTVKPSATKPPLKPKAGAKPIEEEIEYVYADGQPRTVVAALQPLGKTGSKTLAVHFRWRRLPDVEKMRFRRDDGSLWMADGEFKLSDDGVEFVGSMTLDKSAGKTAANDDGEVK
jgi:hypothetical protein